MKKITYSILGLFISVFTFAQTNTFPTTGKVGIGTTSPTYELHTIGHSYSSFGYKVGETNQITHDALFNGYLSSTNMGAVYGAKIFRYLAHSTVNTGGIYGLHVLSGPSFTSSAQNVYGVYTKAQTFSQGTATNAYSLYSESPTGTITNAFNIYASGDAKNYFGGNVGIGTPSPSNILTLRASNALKGIRVESNQGKVSYLGNLGSASNIHRGLLELYDTGTSSIKLAATSGTNSYINAGNVGIGTTTPGEKLEVNGNAIFNGNIESKKVKVTQSPGNWPDYVFAKNYELRTLNEIEDFIKTNQHLPDVPSAKEVQANGLDLGNMDATLLKKVEELTLYMIEMKKEIEELKRENQKLSNEVKRVKK